MKDDFCEPSCLKTVDLFLIAPPDLPPVFLYYDNAFPRPLRRSYGGVDVDASNQSYLETLRAYSAKEPDYKAQFTSNDERDFKQRNELDQFFNNELKPSSQSLVKMVSDVTEMLCQGIAVTIEGNGCASPKFNKPDDRRQVTFNNHLVNRRVDAVKQDLEKLGLTRENWGDLYEFKQVDRDCTQPKRDESVTLDDLQDQKNRKLSVFSIDASVARRVELRAKNRDVQ